MKETAVIQINIGLHEKRLRIYVRSDSAEGRDEAIERLRIALPAIELLENSLAGELVPES